MSLWIAIGSFFGFVHMRKDCRKLCVLITIHNNKLLYAASYEPTKYEWFKPNMYLSFKSNMYIPNMQITNKWRVKKYMDKTSKDKKNKKTNFKWLEESSFFFCFTIFPSNRILSTLYVEWGRLSGCLYRNICTFIHPFFTWLKLSSFFSPSRFFFILSCIVLENIHIKEGARMEGDKGNSLDKIGWVVLWPQMVLSYEDLSVLVGETLVSVWNVHKYKFGKWWLSINH